MATKIAVRQPEYVAGGIMDDVTFNVPSWDELEPTSEEITLAIAPSEELDYFAARRLAKLEARAAKTRGDDALRRAVRTADFDTLADAAHTLTMDGARGLVVSGGSGGAVLTAGARDARYPLARITGDDAEIYTKVTERTKIENADGAIVDSTVTRVVAHRVSFHAADDLAQTVRGIAPHRVQRRGYVSHHGETGKPSRKKWDAGQRRQESAELTRLRTAKQIAQSAMRTTIEQLLAANEPVTNSQWRVALGRSLTRPEMKATKYQRDAAALGQVVESYAGRESAYSRMVNSLSRK